MIYNSPTTFLKEDGSLDIKAVSSYIIEEYESDPTRQQIRLPIDSTSLAVLRKSLGVVNNLTPEGGAMLGTNCLVNGIVDGYIKSRNYVPGSTGWKVLADGTAEFGSVVMRGSVTATTGAIGGFDIGSDYIRDVANSFGLSSTVTGGDDVRFWAGATFANRATAPARITEAGSATFSMVKITGLQSGSDLDGQYISDGTILAGKVNKAIQGWSQTCVFSSTDLNTVSWASGSLIFTDGTTYAIDAGNTGNMSARTYIYFDANVSTTVYQTTTTAATAVGNGKVLIATAINDTASALFEVFGGVGGSFISGNIIAANSIVANQLNVSQLSAISADLGAITAGTIVLPSGGYIRSGQTSWNNGVGFYLGNDSAVPKFSIGNSAGNRLTWDGTTLVVADTNLNICYPQPAFRCNTTGDFSWGGSSTTAIVGRIRIDKSILAVTKVSNYYNTIVYTGTCKIAMFTQDGQTQIFSITSSTISSDVLDTITISATDILAGDYYIVCIPVTTGGNVFTAKSTGFTFPGTFGLYAAGDYALCGTMAVTSGTMPATFDPTAVTHATSAGVYTLMIKLSK